MSGSINVILDKPYYIAGELVTGICRLNVSTTVASANQVAIKWKGYERTKFEIVTTTTEVGPDGSTEFSSETKKYKKEKTFFKETIALQTFNGGSVAPGSYEWRFQYQLPAQLPGVFHYHNKAVSEHRGAIIFKMKAFLDMKGSDIKAKSHIIVVPLLTNQQKVLEASKDKKFLFGGSGKLKLHASIPKDVFCPGETVPIQVNVENNSSKSVAALKVKLMRTVHLKCEDNTTYSKVEEINRMVFDGVKKKTNKSETLNFVLADGIFPSTKGELVECSYRFDVECDVKLAFDLEVQFPVHVFLMQASGGTTSIFNNLPKGAWK